MIYTDVHQICRASGLWERLWRMEFVVYPQPFLASFLSAELHFVILSLQLLYGRWAPSQHQRVNHDWLFTNHGSPISFSSDQFRHKLCHRAYGQFYSVFLGMVFCTETYGWGASSSLFLDLSTGFMGVWYENSVGLHLSVY